MICSTRREITSNDSPEPAPRMQNTRHTSMPISSTRPTRRNVLAHTCHATGCERRIPPNMWGCKRHWFMVPKLVRDRIWEHYRPGQEDDKRPTAEYCLAARDAVIAVAQLEGREPDTRLYDIFLARAGL